MVVTGLGGGDCGYDFRVGERYVIVANRREWDGRLTTSICTATQPVAGAAGLLAYLQSLSAPSQGGRVWGSLMASGSASGRVASVDPIASARVVVSGPTKQSTTTSIDGQFTFTALPSGEYTLSVELPAGRTGLLPIKPRTLRLEAAYACAAVRLAALTNSLIEGTVVDSDGLPVPGVMVDLRPAVLRDPFGGGVWGATTDAHGRYQFESAPAGNYVAGVGIMMGPRRSAPFAVAYARNEGAGREIAVKPGDRLVLPSISVRRLDGIRQEGSVRRPDGQPVAGVIVAARVVGEAGPVPIAAAEVKTDAEGNFTLDLFGSTRYRLTVGNWRRPIHALEIVTNEEPVIVILPPQP